MKAQLYLDVDYTELNHKIGEYRKQNENKMPYLIMNEFTLRVLEINWTRKDIFKDIEDIEKKDGYVGMYMGCKIMIDNDLVMGEIDIR